MPLQHDAQGFLTGNVLADIRRAVDALQAIKEGVSDIKTRLMSMRFPEPVVPRRNQSAANANLPGSERVSGGRITPVLPRQRDAQGRFISDLNENNTGQATNDSANPPSPRIIPPSGDIALPNGGGRRRNRRGQFTGNDPNPDPNPDDENKKNKTLANGIGDRIATAIHESKDSIENADPVVKAFNEVATPLRNGYQVLFGGRKEETHWLKKIFKGLAAFKKFPSVFDRISRSLHNLENRENENGNGGSQSFLGGLFGSISPWIMRGLASLGPMLLTGVTAVLGTVFGPVGLAISAAGLAAWALFSEDGKKFFARIGDDFMTGWNAITENIKTTWDGAVKVFTDVWEPIKQWFDDKLGIVSDTFNKAGNTVNNAVKNFTGVDIKESAKSAYGAVSNAVKSGYESVKAAPKKLKDKWDEAKQYFIQAAKNTGVDPGTLAKTAYFESGFNSDARPIRKDGTVLSSAHGYGQFLDSTWTEMVNKYGAKYGVANAGNLSKAEAAKLRSDKSLQANLLAEFTKENIERGRELGGSNDDANVYALHNLGSGDGPRFLKALRQNPNARVSDILSSNVIAGNKSLYGNGNISISEAYQRMGNAMNRGEAFAKDIRSVPTFTAQMPIQTAPINTVTIPSPKVPVMPPPPPIAESPEIKEPLGSGFDDRYVSLNLQKNEVGQNLSDRSIAHIVTGGIGAPV